MFRLSWSTVAAAIVVAPAQAQQSPVVTAAPLATTIVIGARREDTPAKLDHISPEVDGPKITVTKKTSVTKLDLVPTVIDNNQREQFARLPGLLVVDQATPATFNLSYRGLGNPQASEFVLALEDGAPITSDPIGMPTLHYEPLPQSVARVELVRGGSSLLYGPNPAPALNFVSKRPKAGDPLSVYSEQAGGSDGLLSSYTAVQATTGAFEYRGSFGLVRSDGQRTNAGSRQLQGDLYLAWRPDAGHLWYLDLTGHDVSAGDPGQIGLAQFDANPATSLTPFNHDWVRRVGVTAGTQSALGHRWSLDAKVWYTALIVSSRTAADEAPGASPPATTTLTDAAFHTEGLDARVVKRWGHGNAFTLGVTGIHDHAPLRQSTSFDLTAPRDTNAGTPRLDQDRDSYYGAIFAENVFRLPHRWHIVPSVRIDHETIAVAERFRPPEFNRPLVNTSVGRTVPLFGLGTGFDFGHQNETYFSVTQGYRPLRFVDVAPPFANVAGAIPNPARSLSFEAGVHGTPIPGLFYDAGLFWIDFRDRIETLALSNTVTVERNSGDTRHRGFDGELSYDLLARGKTGQHLTVFANLSLLDATFTRSLIPDRAGNQPAYAPHVIAKCGISLLRDRRYDISVTGQTVSSQYWQDSDLPGGSGASFVPAKVPAYTVVDVASDIYLTRNIRLLGGIANLGDRTYYVRVFANGIEPARGRTFHVGAAAGF